jgi:hypothetical protein
MNSNTYDVPYFVYCIDRLSLRAVRLSTEMDSLHRKTFKFVNMRQACLRLNEWE